MEDFSLSVSFPPPPQSAFQINKLGEKRRPLTDPSPWRWISYSTEFQKPKFFKRYPVSEVLHHSSMKWLNLPLTKPGTSWGPSRDPVWLHLQLWEQSEFVMLSRDWENEEIPEVHYCRHVWGCMAAEQRYKAIKPGNAHHVFPKPWTVKQHRAEREPHTRKEETEEESEDQCWKSVIAAD